MHYRGFYINLDRDPQRRQGMEAQLAACQLQAAYQRHPGALGNVLGANAPKLSPGDIGCITSHYQLLRSLSGSDHHVHILEDDALLSPRLGSILDSLVQAGWLENVDLLFTDIAVPINTDHIRDLQALFRQCVRLDAEGNPQRVEKFTLLGLKGRKFGGTASYLVNRRAIGKVAGLFEEAMREGISQPIDLFYRHHINEGRLTAACVFPFLTTVHLERSLASNISQGTDPGLQRSLLATTLLRHSFYLHADVGELLRVAEDRLQTTADDRRTRLLSSLLRFAASADFHPF